MLTLGLNENIDQLAIANSVCWKDRNVLRTLDFEIKGQRKKGRI